jgi:hypothetical protein
MALVSSLCSGFMSTATVVLLLDLRRHCVLPPLNSIQVLTFALGLVVWIVAGTHTGLTLELPDQKGRGFMVQIALLG